MRDYSQALISMWCSDWLGTKVVVSDWEQYLMTLDVTSACYTSPVEHHTWLDLNGFSYVVVELCLSGQSQTILCHGHRQIVTTYFTVDYNLVSFGDHIWFTAKDNNQIVTIYFHYIHYGWKHWYIIHIYGTSISTSKTMMRLMSLRDDSDHLALKNAPKFGTFP